MNDRSRTRTTPRLWPAVVMVVIQWGLILAPAVAPGAGVFAIIGGVAGAVVVLVWWLLFRRVPWLDRLGVLVLMAAALLATSPFIHESVTGGMMGMMWVVFSLPLFSLALVASLVVSRRLAPGTRRVTMLTGILLACAAITLVRTDGLSAEGGPQLHWRWTDTPEERLLAVEDPIASAPGTTAPSTTTPGTDPAPGTQQPHQVPGTKVPGTAAAWPSFRGPNRDDVVAGVRINTDWVQHPPVQLWRRPVGPGWSSFAVIGDLLYTQEQRGDDETVACYRLSTGEPVWRHRDPVRFWESNGGAGPRATPTLSGGRVYAFGATGILNALDAANGAVIWSRDAAADASTETPGWGFSSSPLVVDDVVIVAVSGTLAGYDASTGKMRWVGPKHGGSYSSPHLATIHGVTQILVLSGAGATSVHPRDGKTLWEYAWEGSPIIQPAVIADGDLLVSTGGMMGGIGIRRIAVSRGEAGWTVAERWESTGLKPYFNDMVVHEGHAYGFDGSILASINLADGTRAWKGGRYGGGQMMLLPEQDLLLVLSEEGELALVSATPDRFREIARVPALDGKTWNHPVLVGDILLVRNGEEMAAFRLAR